jgi:hypothetical protein
MQGKERDNPSQNLTGSSSSGFSTHLTAATSEGQHDRPELRKDYLVLQIVLFGNGNSSLRRASDACAMQGGSKAAGFAEQRAKVRDSAARRDGICKADLSVRY